MELQAKIDGRWVTIYRGSRILTALNSAFKCYYSSTSKGTHGVKLKSGQNRDLRIKNSNGYKQLFKADIERF